MNITEARSFIAIYGQELPEGKTIERIEIPIIQRDYAQGRTTKEVERIRNQFVSVLYKALVGGPEDSVKLDFVYGNVEEGKLIPLDGQQRLTTLFLLHWYVAKHENIEPDNYMFLRGFTYRTRFSSQHFCESLVGHSPDFDVECLSDWIVDQNWFMYSWEQDPTIKSMLVMLDKLHITFRAEFNLWDRLVDREKSPIRFYFLPLEEMGLTDSLYIKMNSRGKPLTEFEHFKAEFEQIIRPVAEDLYNKFVEKIDIDWVDMLWKYRGDDNVTDDEFMRYYRFLTEMLCFQQEIEIEENNFDLAEKLYGLKNSKAKSNLEFLFSAFDCWEEMPDIRSFFDSLFSEQEYQLGKVVLYSENKNLFRLCCDNYGIISGNRRQFTLNNSLLLFGVIIYLINKSNIVENDFKERLRSLRNLVWKSPDEIREKRMKALLGDTEALVLQGKLSNKTLGFNEIQKSEEIEKFQWRKDYPNLIEQLNRLEEHSLLQGQTAIIGLEAPELFAERARNFQRLFDESISLIEISKALLAIDDYSQLASTWRFLFGSANDSTWRELFTKSKQRKMFKRTQSVILSLLDSINGDFSSYLNQLTSDYLSDNEKSMDWRYYFIKYSEMRMGNSGVYYWRSGESSTKDDQYEVYMMNTSVSLNGRHWDPFLYVLKNDAELKDLLTLEEYGDPLIINETGKKIENKNTCWEIYNSNKELIKTINVKQHEGVDCEDRIALMKKHLLSDLL